MGGRGPDPVSPEPHPQCTSRLHSASPKAAEAARLLLTDMWSSKELQSVLRQVRAPHPPVPRRPPGALGLMASEVPAGWAGGWGGEEVAEGGPGTAVWLGKKGDEGWWSDACVRTGGPGISAETEGVGGAGRGAGGVSRGVRW